MKNTEKNAPRAAPTGNKYSCVSALMKGEQVPKEIQDKVRHLINESCIATRMAQLRHLAGITQEQMASALGVNQPAISKLEAGRDDGITLLQIKEYSRITGQRISLLFGKPFTPAEAVKNHADGLKFWLDQLAEMASQNESLQSEIKGFISDTFYNLFNIIALCNSKLPIGEEDDIADIRMEIVTGKKVVAPTDKASPASKELATA